MAWLKERAKQDGTVMYTGLYRDLRGRERSAGTSSSRREALREAIRAENRAHEGRIGDPKRGRQTLEHYVRQEWLPHHVMEDSTRESYTYVIDKHVLPSLGGMRMADIMPWHVRDWITELGGKGVKPPTIRSAKVCLDAILSTAFHDQVTFLHAGRGVKTPTLARKPRRVITAEHYQRLHDALADPVMQLLVETDIETGLRWGELSELRVKDLDLAAGMVTVARAVVHLKAARNGRRFVVKDHPKDTEWRQVSIATHLVTKLRAHVDAHGLRPDDLLFPLPHTDGPSRRTRPATLPDPATLGLTPANEHGRRYQHGTLTAYQAAKCRCRHCKNAVAAYRAGRRTTGKDQPRRQRTTSTDTDRHMSNDWFRTHVWNPALAKASLGFRVTPHGLRHAHASWLLAGGADLQVVKERLGHASIATTERYLHTLPDARKAALAALDNIRTPQNGAPISSTAADIADTAETTTTESERSNSLDDLDPETVRTVLSLLLAQVQAPTQTPAAEAEILAKPGDSTSNDRGESPLLTWITRWAPAPVASPQQPSSSVPEGRSPPASKPTRSSD